MDKILVELLKLRGAVILPNFGTLSIVDEETRELMFNEYLKFNDGKLIAHICENSNMDEQEASNTLAKYIREIQLELDKGGTYDIFGIGGFKKDSDGGILFEGSLSDQQQTSTVILGPSPTPEPVEVTITVTEESLNSEGIREESSSTAESVTVRKEKPVKPTKKVKPTKEPKPKKKKSVFFYILIALLIVIAFGGTFVGLKYDEVKTYFGWNKFPLGEPIAEVISTELEEPVIEAENDEIIDSEDQVFEADDVTEEGVTEEVVTQNPIPQPAAQSPVNTSGAPFHVVGGSFGEQSNAENFVNELKGKGYPSHIVGEFNGMHMVSVKSFSDKSEAVNFISTVQQDAPKAWLFKHPK